MTIGPKSGNDEPLTIEAGGDVVRARVGRSARPDATLTGPSRIVAAVITGKRPPTVARPASPVRETRVSSNMFNLWPSIDAVVI